MPGGARLGIGPNFRPAGQKTLMVGGVPSANQGFAVVRGEFQAGRTQNPDCRRRPLGQSRVCGCPVDSVRQSRKAPIAGRRGGIEPAGRQIPIAGGDAPSVTGRPGSPSFTPRVAPVACHWLRLVWGWKVTFEVLRPGRPPARESSPRHKFGRISRLAGGKATAAGRQWPETRMLRELCGSLGEGVGTRAHEFAAETFEILRTVFAQRAPKVPHQKVPP